MLKTVGNPSTRYGDQTILNGNLVIGTAGKGIDFSASTHAAGMTSELFDDYEEGTWSPVIGRLSTASDVTYTVTGTYTKIGRQVTLNAKIAISAITTQGTGLNRVTGFPFAQSEGDYMGAGAVYMNAGFATKVVTACSMSTLGILFHEAINAFANVDTNWQASTISFSLTYNTAA